MSESSALETLIAKEAIRDLVFRYCRAVDRRDFAVLRTLYHDDAYDDHGEYFRGSAPDYVDWLEGALVPNKVTAHQVFNHLIRVEGDYAEGEVYLQGYHLLPGEDGGLIDLITGGRYLDKYERRGVDWKFSHRKIVSDWNVIRPTQCTWDAMQDGETEIGGHGADDPAAGFFRLI